MAKAYDTIRIAHPQIRVPHLRRSFIATKVGIAKGDRLRISISPIDSHYFREVGASFRFVARNLIIR